MDNSIDLLYEILGTVSRIEQNSKSSKKFSSSESKISSKSEKPKETDLFKGNKDISKISAASIKGMGEAIATFASGVSSYMVIRILGGTKILDEITTFLKNIESINTEKVNITGQTIASIGRLLDIMTPNKIIGLMMLGKLADSSTIKNLIISVGESLKEFDSKNNLERARSFVIVIQELTNKNTISGLKKLGKLDVKVAKNVGAFMKALSEGLSEVPDIKNIREVAESVNLLTKSLLYVVGAIGAIVLIGFAISQVDNPLEVLGYTAVLMVASVGILHFMISEANRLEKSGEAIGSISKALMALTGTIGVIMLLGALLLLTGKPLEILGLSAAVMIGVIAILSIGIVASNYVKQGAAGLESIGNALLSLTKVVAITMLLGSLLLLTGKPLEILGLTALIVLMEVGILLVVSKAAASLKGSEKAIEGLYKTLISITICVGAVLLMASLLALSDEPYRILGIAGTILLGMIGLITIISLVDKALDFEKAGKGIIALGKGMLLLSVALAAMMLCISFTLIPLINKINETDSFWGGLGAISLIVVGLIAITSILGFLLDNKSTSKVLIFGAAAMIGLAVIMTAIGFALNPIISASMRIAEQPGSFWIGFGSIVGVLLISALITASIGALMSTGAGLLIGGLGVVAMLGLAEVMKALSSGIDPIIESSLKIGTQGPEFWGGLGDMGKVLGLVGLALVAAGALAIPMAAGELVLLGLGKVLKTLGSGLDTIIDLGLKVGPNKDQISSNMKAITGLIVDMVDSLDEIGVIGGAKIALIGKSLNPLFECLGMYTDIILKLSSNTFVKGFDANGKPIFEQVNIDYALAGTAIGTKFISFIEALIPQLDGLDKSKTKVIKRLGESLSPLIDSLSKYVDVICKMADPSGIYIIKGYDENGKPIYSNEKVDFGSIAANIATSFINFIDLLSVEMEKVKKDSMSKMKIVGNALKPVMEVLDIYVGTLEKIGDPAKLQAAASSAVLISSSIKSSVYAFMDEDFISKVTKYYGGALTKSRFSIIRNAVEDIAGVFESYGKILKNAGTGNVDSKAVASTIIATVETFMNSEFIDRVADLYGGTFSKSKFGIIKSSVEDIADVFESYEKILKVSSLEGNAISVANDLISLVNTISSDNLISNLDKIDVAKFAKLEDVINGFKPSIKLINELNAVEMTSTEKSIINYIDSLGKFLNTDFSKASLDFGNASEVFDQSLIKIDQALNRNRHTRLLAMKEFSQGALELAKSIDQVYAASSRVSSNTGDLKDIIKDLKEVEKTRLEDSTIKLQYEQQLSDNRNKEREIVQKSVETVESTNAKSVQAQAPVVEVNSTAGMTPEQMQVFAQYIAREVATAVVSGLTSGIKKFSFDFRNSTEELIGNLHIE